MSEQNKYVTFFRFHDGSYGYPGSRIPVFDDRGSAMEHAGHVCAQRNMTATHPRDYVVAYWVQKYVGDALPTPEPPHVDFKPFFVSDPSAPHSTARFTDGPRAQSGATITAPTTEVGIHTGVMGEIIARVARWPGHGDECNANASLIAAAPEMYRPLRAAVPLLQGSGNPHWQDDAARVLELPCPSRAYKRTVAQP